MKRGFATKVVAGAAACAAVVVLYAQTAATDPMFQAMHDEMERARKLTLNNLEAPYFVQYLIDESDNFTVSASD